LLKPTLLDSYGRRMKKLRISLLDACNLQCIYCMPEKFEFIKSHDLLRPEEIFSIAKNLNLLGMDEIRLTGGEPTLRPDLIDIVKMLSTLKLSKLGITTNGVKLQKFLVEFKALGLNSINISLDALDLDTFHRMTGSFDLPVVMNNILWAKDLGFNVKINCVVMRTQNLSQLENFIQFALTYGIEVRFLELMKIGVANHFFEKEFVSSQELIEIIKTRHQMIKMDVEKDSTSFNFMIDGVQSIGFIASESQAFCESCSRLRLDAKGNLRSCLMKEDRIAFRNIPFEDYAARLNSLLELKPMKRIEKIDQYMNQIGG
jgi:cyclic pyranopterin phosphate synthase